MFRCWDMLSILVALLGQGWEDDGPNQLVRHHYVAHMEVAPDEHLYIVTGVLPICAEKIIRVLPKGTPA